MTSSAPILLVTGGSRGIGAAVCISAAKAGWHILVNYASSHEAAQAVVMTINAQGGKASALRADIGNAADIDAMFAMIDRDYGPISGLVNNAGIIDQPCRVDDMTPDRLDRMFRVNTIGSILVAGQAVKRMSTRNGGMGGAIVNISSMAALIGAPGQYVDYAASKGAIDTFTTGLALEVAGEGIRVNGVRPGIIDTDIHASGGIPDRAAAMASKIPMQRAGSAAEVADAVLYLLSPQASYITGAILNVSGGR